MPEDETDPDDAAKDAAETPPSCAGPADLLRARVESLEE